MPRSLSIVIVLALVGSVLGAAPLLAQDATSHQPGITTTGYGFASAEAESADLQFLIINENFYGGLPPFPEVEATPGAEARATVAPIVDAIEARDAVEGVAVVLPVVLSLYGGPTPIARIDVTVANPDLELLTNLIVAVSQAAASERLLIGYVGASFNTSDCDALERDARQAALEEARGRAEIQADLLGVGLGEVMTSADVGVAAGVGYDGFGVHIPNSDGCAPHAAYIYGGEFSTSVSLPRFDPTSHTGEVEIHVQLQITFAIESSGATPTT